MSDDTTNTHDLPARDPIFRSPPIIQYQSCSFCGAPWIYHTLVPTRLLRDLTDVTRPQRVRELAMVEIRKIVEASE